MVISRCFSCHLPRSWFPSEVCHSCKQSSSESEGRVGEDRDSGKEHPRIGRWEEFEKHCLAFNWKWSVSTLRLCKEGGARSCSSRLRPVRFSDFHFWRIWTIAFYYESLYCIKYSTKLSANHCTCQKWEIADCVNWPLVLTKLPYMRLMASHLLKCDDFDDLQKVNVFDDFDEWMTMKLIMCLFA